MRKRTEPAVISKGCQGVHGWLAVHEAGRTCDKGALQEGFCGRFRICQVWESSSPLGPIPHRLE